MSSIHKDRYKLEEPYITDELVSIRELKFATGLHADSSDRSKVLFTERNAAKLLSQALTEAADNGNVHAQLLLSIPARLSHLYQQIRAEVTRCIGGKNRLGFSEAHIEELTNYVYKHIAVGVEGEFYVPESGFVIRTEEDLRIVVEQHAKDVTIDVTIATPC